MTYQFNNRSDAGKKLAEALSAYKNRDDVVLLALPRGGVPVAYEVAQALSIPLDVLLVRKLGVPGHQELAMGAITLNGIGYVNPEIVSQFNISKNAIDDTIGRENKELLRRNTLYRADTPSPEIKGKTVIVVDDGLATGATMHVAVAALHKAKAAHIVVAVPVGTESTCKELAAEVDEVICIYTPEPFFGVGQWYKDFSQTTDDEVRDLLGTSSQKTYKYKK